MRSMSRVMRIEMSKNIPKKVRTTLFFVTVFVIYFSSLQEEWVAVLKSNDIGAGDLVPVEVDGLAILVAADLDGKIFAIANSCPHLGTPLENGRYFFHSCLPSIFSLSVYHFFS